MANQIRRREFIGTVGSAIAWPLAVCAQQPATRVIGFLHLGSPEPVALSNVAAFRQGLNETGFIDGRNWRSSIAGRGANMTD